MQMGLVREKFVLDLRYDLKTTKVVKTTSKPKIFFASARQATQLHTQVIQEKLEGSTLSPTLPTSWKPRKHHRDEETAMEACDCQGRCGNTAAIRELRWKN